MTRLPTRPRTHRALALLAAGGLVWALAGCASQPTLDASTGETLQAGVVEIAQRADGGDPVGALAQLDLFEEELDAAAADGRIGDEREAEVRDAVALVRADLEAVIAAAEEPAEETTAPATTEPSTDTGDTGDTGADESNSGPGNNNGNGNGNSGPGNNNGNGGGNGND